MRTTSRFASLHLLSTPGTHTHTHTRITHRRHHTLLPNRTHAQSAPQFEALLGRGSAKFCTAQLPVLQIITIIIHLIDIALFYKPKTLCCTQSHRPAHRLQRKTRQRERPGK